MERIQRSLLVCGRLTSQVEYKDKEAIEVGDALKGKAEVDDIFVLEKKCRGLKECLRI